MTINEIVKTAAAYLGDDEVYEYLDESKGDKTADKTVLDAVNNYTRCANVVISELAASFIPMIKQEKINKNKIGFSELSEKILKIISVTDDCERDVAYETTLSEIKCNKNSFTITYSFLPSNYGLTDLCEFSDNKVTAANLGLGVAAEVCLTRRAFDESLIWRKRYSDAITEITVPKSVTAKKRRWI